MSFAGEGGETMAVFRAFSLKHPLMFLRPDALFAGDAEEHLIRETGVSKPTTAEIARYVGFSQCTVSLRNILTNPCEFDIMRT